MEWATLPLKKYADFTGRSRRKEFWSFALLTLAIYIVAGLIDGMLGMSGLVYGLYGPVALLVALALLIPGLAVSIRRLHDTDRSGWWVLLSIVPVIGLVLIYFYILEGTRGANAHGPDPKAAEAAPATVG